MALYTGHAPANFAFVAVLSFKIRFTRFQQVQTGSDYPVLQTYIVYTHTDYFLFYILSLSICKNIKQLYVLDL